MNRFKITRFLLHVLEEYLHSPFFIMGACLVIIEWLSHYLIAAEHFIILYWADQFHLVFLVPAFYLAREFSQLRYRTAIKMLIFRKKNRSHAFLIINILNIILYLEIVFFFVEALLIMAGQFKNLGNSSSLVMWDLATKSIIFIAIPLTAMICQFLIKYTLFKDGIFLIDHIEYEKVLLRAWMLFIITLITVSFFSFTTTTNYYLESLNWLSNILKPYTDILRNISGLISNQVIRMVSSLI